MSARDELLFLALGGSGEIGMNVNLYGCRGKWLMADMGLTFADPDYPGIDLILPELEFIERRMKDLVGIVLTHGHEDHLGALPYILPSLPGDFEIFATPLTAAFISGKLKEFGINKKVNSINFDKDVVLGSFLISFIRITHSVPDTSNIFIKTPIGNFYHGSDFKFDFTPYDGKKTDFAKIVRHADEGIISLMSDSLGSERKGFTASEQEIGQTIYNEMGKTQGKFLFTTYSSNLSRLNQALDAARALNRRVCFVGRSLLKAKDVGLNLGYIKIDRNMEIDLKEVRNYNDKQIVLIVAGSQGQQGSALSRIVNGENRDITLNDKDCVMFSSDPIPGNEVAINALIDEIAQSGARVIYSDIMERIHVSGHGSRGDLSLMMSLVRPQNVLPIGGTYKHMVAYKDLAKKNGFADKNIILPQDGQEVIFNKSGQATLGKKTHLQNVYVDQVSGEEVETFVLRDREKISKEGIVVIMVEVDTYGAVTDRPNIVARGFSAGETAELTKGLPNEIRNNLRSKKTKVTDWNYIRKTISNISEKYILTKLKRRPLVLPVVIEV